MVTEEQTIEMLDLERIKELRVVEIRDKSGPTPKTTHVFGVKYNDGGHVNLSPRAEYNLDKVAEVIGRLNVAGKRVGEDYEIIGKVVRIRREEDRAEGVILERKLKGFAQ